MSDWIYGQTITGSGYPNGDLCRAIEKELGMEEGSVDFIITMKDSPESGKK